jgi:hypothetical protein
MISLKPRLSIKRLLVFSKGRAVYDQAFKLGVNIIRGSNSSGKSTIADFMFFVLGGDVNSWKPEAERCDEVIAEISVNGAPLTLRRYVTANSRQAMHLFWGDYDTASKSAVEGWNVYPFRRTDRTESFSQVLFRALDMPEVRSDSDSNITMHQILRLIYIDQLSPVQSLMRQEDFDSHLTRKAVGDLLLGLYDDSVYSDELRMREKQKELEAATRQIESVLLVLGEAHHAVDIEAIEKNISDVRRELDRVHATLGAAKAGESTGRAQASPDIRRPQEAYLALQKSLAAAYEIVGRLELEVEDSRQFIANLESRMAALDESVATRSALGQLPLNVCPHCLSVLQPPSSETVCVLCHQELTADAGKAQAMRMRQEIALQAKESRILLEEKEKALGDERRKIPAMHEGMRAAQKTLETELNKIQSQRDSQIDELLVNKGTLEGKIDALLQQAKAVGILETLKARKVALTAEVQKLALSIQTKRTLQRVRLSEALGKIEHYARELLRKDLLLEESFQVAQAVTFDFSKDTFAVDGRNQFSASSITYLKNCIHYGMFFAALDLEFFRYPRFIICDNMEDKGMQEDRSRNFQRVIVEMSKTFDVEHQIIFTTSMIDPTLDNAELCVGPKYTQAHKSLSFA